MHLGPLYCCIVYSSFHGAVRKIFYACSIALFLSCIAGGTEQLTLLLVLMQYKPYVVPVVDPRSSSTSRFHSYKQLSPLGGSVSGKGVPDLRAPSLEQQAAGPRALAAPLPARSLGGVTRCFGRLRGMMTAAMGSGRKRRYFQLSADLTTLRWAWNKYVVLYYVDSLTIVPSDCSITLHMILDPGEGAQLSPCVRVLLWSIGQKTFGLPYSNIRRPIT
jgi:hypothetical protein